MPKHKHTRPAQPNPASNLLILGGVILFLLAIFLWKNANQGTSTQAGSLEAQLDAALADHRPTFVFLHSLDCIPCKEMMGTVAAVYPEFQGAVVLIDVDIYDPANENLLSRERLQSIPTLVFYNAQGQRQVYIGAMPADQFRQTLTQLAQGQ